MNVVRPLEYEDPGPDQTSWLDPTGEVTVESPGRGLTSGDDSNAQRRGAAAAEPRSGTRRRLVLDALRSFGEDGATDDELCEATGLDYSNLGPRRRELASIGYCVDTGETRSSRAGVQVTVWRAVR